MNSRTWGRIRRLSRQGGAVIAAAGCVVVAMTQSGSASPTTPHARATVTPVSTATGTISGRHVVTLVTGDRVTISAATGGKALVDVVPGAGRGHVGFIRRTTVDRAGRADVFVFPTDALPALRAGRLDPRLFDVSGLVRQHLDDAATPRLPLIVSYGTASGHAPAMSAPALRAAGAPLLAVPGARLTHTLPALDAVSLSAAKRGAAAMWPALSGGTAGTGARAATPAVAHVWLDARQHVLDDESNAQIGVPVAWQAGYTGAGVKVAVLDTGYDTTHPDLAGVVIAAQDFTGSPDGVTDGFGHGTHVASIVAGSGAASNGKYRGVAPDAKLLAGKVCTDDGFCDDSAVIAGMQWAADQGARVANLSLGGTDLPGVDPLEQAVDDLTASAGTLFVIAAGNDGTFLSVSSPGSADAALTVASVSKQDVLSDFSSRGPRTGDDAMKPDIAAPGEAIIAARAAGTSLGDVVDQFYTSLSGTSMATPHVTGAAAILASEHPDWTAAQLKDELMSTANPIAGADDYGQGDGRVDVARSVTQHAYAATPSLSFGLLSWPQTGLGPATEPVTYVNDGDSPITLALNASVTDASGNPAPAGMFTLSATGVTVPAHGTADVSLTLTPANDGPAGAYSGRIEATDGGGDRVEVDFGTTVEPESYTVTMHFIDRDGHAPTDLWAPYVDVQNLGSPGEFPPFVQVTNGTATLRLVKGDYGIDADVVTPDAAGQFGSDTVLAAPLLHVDHPGIVLTFDGRSGHPFQARVDRAGAQPLAKDFGVLWTVDTPFGPFPVGTDYGFAGDFPIYLAPAHSTAYGFTTNAQALLTSPFGASNQFQYHLAANYPGRAPDGIDWRPHDRDLATVHALYRSQDMPGTLVGQCPYPQYTPDQNFFVGWCATWNLPAHVTELYSPAPDVLWAQNAQVYSATDEFPGFDGIFTGNAQALAKGSVTARTWNSAVAGPELDTGQFDFGTGAHRDGDDLFVATPLFGPADPGSLVDILDNLTATGSTTLTRGGTVIGSDPSVFGSAFTLPPAPAWYTLSVTAQRAPTWSRLSPKVSAVWRFRSGHTGDFTTLPLLEVRATGAFDDFDRAPAGAAFRLDLTPGVSAGAMSSPITAVTVQASTDGGKTWHDTTVTHGSGGVWHAIVHDPASGLVSLRIGVRDQAGSSLQETIYRAYGVS